MPDQFDADGLQIKTLTELTEELEAALRAIYGADINLDPSSPDGQMVGIFAQAAVDLRELLSRINAGFDPEQAEGAVLDQRVGLNGIERQGATFTRQTVEVEVDRALTLEGLDDQEQELDGEGYEVKDDAGNVFVLLATEVIAGAGTYPLLFRAREIGAVQVQPNTITIPVTIVPGVLSLNNPSAVSVQGRDEKSDVALRTRRRRSVSLPAVGYLDSIEAAVAAVEGVTTAIALENDTGVVDVDGTPAHSIWVIAEGGAEEDIGQVIYAKKPPGIGMRGEVEVLVPRPDGRQYLARFDRPIDEDLWIRFQIQLPGGVVDATFIRAQIVAGVLWPIGTAATSDEIISFLKGLDSNYRITQCAVSPDGEYWSEVLEPDSPQHRFINSTERIELL